MKKSLFLEKIMDTAWLIKQSTSGYKLYRNINMLATILHDYIIYEDRRIKFSARVYYHYYIYLGIDERNECNE